MERQLAVSYKCTPVRKIDAVSENRPASIGIVETVAELEETDPAKLPVLADTIDPDMIDTFVASTNAASTGALCFTYSGWNVFVRADGTIIVGDPQKMTEPTPLY